MKEKNQELTQKQRGSEKSESRRVIRKIRGSGLGAPIRTFRPEDHSMTQKQRVLQGTHSLQLIVDVIRPSMPPIIWSSIHPPTHYPSTHQPFIHSADKPNILGQDLGHAA